MSPPRYLVRELSRTSPRAPIPGPEITSHPRLGLHGPGGGAEAHRVSTGAITGADVPRRRIPFSRHGTAPGANCAAPSNPGVQDRPVARGPVATSRPSEITAKGSSLSNGQRHWYWPTARRILPYLRPAPRSIASHRCSAAWSRTQWRHTRLGSRLIRVFSGVYSWFHLRCVFGVLLGVGRGWQVVMILGPDHECPVLSQPSGLWLMTPGDDD